MSDSLYIISCISNPARFQRRIQLFNEFVERTKKLPGVILLTCELQQGERPFTTNADLQLRTESEIWSKEMLMNVTVWRLLPPQAKYLCFLDADVEFLQGETFAQDVILALQTHPVVQPFSHAIDMGPSKEVIGTHTSFAFVHHTQGLKRDGSYSRVAAYSHPGYGIAMRKSVFDAIGGLIDYSILGSGDLQFWMAMMGLVKYTFNNAMSSGYKSKLLHYQERCLKAVQCDIGYLKGTILHHFHGAKKNRRYVERWDILRKHSFDPDRDLIRDSQ